MIDYTKIVKRLRDEGASVPEIADALGLKVDDVKQYIAEGTEVNPGRETPLNRRPKKQPRPQTTPDEPEPQRVRLKKPRKDGVILPGDELEPDDDTPRKKSLARRALGATGRYARDVAAESIADAFETNLGALGNAIGGGIRKRFSSNRLSARGYSSRTGGDGFVDSQRVDQMTTSVVGKIGELDATISKVSARVAGAIDGTSSRVVGALERLSEILRRDAYARRENVAEESNLLRGGPPAKDDGPPLVSEVLNMIGKLGVVGGVGLAMSEIGSGVGSMAPAVDLASPSVTPRTEPTPPPEDDVPEDPNLRTAPEVEETPPAAPDWTPPPPPRDQTPDPDELKFEADVIRFEADEIELSKRIDGLSTPAGGVLGVGVGPANSGGQTLSGQGGDPSGGGYVSPGGGAYGGSGSGVPQGESGPASQQTQSVSPHLLSQDVVESHPDYSSASQFTPGDLGTYRTSAARRAGVTGDSSQGTYEGDPSNPADHMLRAVMQAETGSSGGVLDERRFIRTRVTPTANKGRHSSAYGPVQMTKTYLDDFKARHGESLPDEEKEYLDRLITQGQDMLRIGRSGNWSDPTYGYGGKGVAGKTERDRQLYGQIAQRSMVSLANRSRSYQDFIGSFRGENDPRYFAKIARSFGPGVTAEQVFDQLKSMSPGDVPSLGEGPSSQTRRRLLDPSSPRGGFDLPDPATGLSPSGGSGPRTRRPKMVDTSREVAGAGATIGGLSAAADSGPPRRRAPISAQNESTPDVSPEDGSAGVDQEPLNTAWRDHFRDYPGLRDTPEAPGLN